MDEPWTVLKALEWTTQRFEATSIDNPRLDAQVLLAHALGCSRIELYTQYDRPLDDGERTRFRELIRGRLARSPVAYLIGEKEFWSLPIRVNENVLIPRPDTEILVQTVLDRRPDVEAPRICEIATGSGAVCIALAKELALAQITATDISPAALELAEENATRLDLNDRIGFLQGDLFAALDADQRFDIIVANLPYIPSGELAQLDEDVRGEPRLALDGGDDGLVVLRRFMADVQAYLQPGALVALEHGFDQGPDLRKLAVQAGLSRVETVQDLAGHDRVCVAYAPAVVGPDGTGAH